MSSGIANPPPLPDQQPSPANMPLPPPSPFEKMIEQRLTQTRRQVKNVDIATGMLVLFAGASIYLFAAVLADHWLVSGGFGFWGRFLLWAILFAAAGAYFVVKLWPAIAYRINPIFAAETIEKSKPSLKNSLINFLLLRGHEREVAPIVYRAMEQRAAADLKQVQVDIAVDRHNILRGGYVLMGVLVIFCLYLILSPKNPIVSAGRILWPWSNSHAPTRVSIVEVQPGDTSAFNGDSIMVSAEVRGLKDGEPVLLHFSTTDGQVIDQTLPMKQAKGHYRYQGQLPPGELGLQQDHTYFLSAGDFRTENYRVEVQIPPSIVIDRLEFHYPPYTGQPDRTVPRQGDIRALEGTEVTIRAEANQPIRDAYVDLNCLGNATSMARMDVKDKTATYRLALHTNPQDPSKPEYESYQIRFTDAKGRENRRPIRYRIEVLPDLQPEVTVVQPEQQETTIAADGKLEIHVRASDPDFALRRVAIHAEREGSKLALPPLLDLKPPKEGKIGEFVGQFEFEPSKLELKPGDRVEFSAEADDNKEPDANHTATAKKTIIIAGAEKQQANANQPHPANRNKRPGEKNDKNDSADKQDNEPSNQQADEDKNKQPENKQDPGEKKPEKRTDKKEKPQNPGEKQKPNEQNPPEDQQNNPQEEQGDPGDSAQQNPGGEKPKTGEKNASKTKDGSKSDTQDKNQEAGEEPQEKIDPNAQEGDAMRIINNDLEKQKQKNNPEEQNQQNTQNQQNNDKQSGDKQSGDKQSGDKQSGDKQSGDKQSGDKQSGDKQSGDKQSGDKQSGDKQSGNKQSDNKQSGDKQSGDKQSGDKQSGDKQSGDKQSGDKQTGDKQTGDKQTGDKQSGDKQSGDKKSGDKQSGDKQSGDKQSGDKQSGDKQSGDKQSGDKQSRDKQSGDKQSGDKQSGDKQSGDKQSGDKQSGDKQSGDKQSGDKQSGDKQSGDKQSDDKQSSDKQSGDKQSGDKQSSDKQSGDKQSGDKQSGDKQSGDKQSGDKQSGDKQSGDKQSGDKQSNDKQSGDKQSGDKQSGDKQSGDKKTGDKQQPKDGATKSDPLDKAGDGTPTNQKDPPPEPQGFNKPNKNMKPGEDAAKKDKKPDEAQTTSVSDKQSDSKGEESGSQSGGGGQGGGQKADKEGKGSAGSHKPSDDNGGQTSQEKGPGDVGNTSGQDAKSDQNSGSDSKQKSSGDGTGETQPGGEGEGGKQDNDNSGGSPSQNPQEGNASGTQSSDSPATSGQGMPNVGGNKSAPDAAERAPSAEPGGDAANLDYARKQSELALRHLQQEAEKDNSELLDKLGWSKEDAKRFLDRWQQLHRDARDSGPKGKEAKRELDDALKSLGLRPRTTQIGSGSTTRDREKDLRNRGTFAPPADWAEQFHEYQRSVPEPKK